MRRKDLPGLRHNALGKPDEYILYTGTWHDKPAWTDRFVMVVGIPPPELVAMKSVLVLPLFPDGGRMDIAIPASFTKAPRRAEWVIVERGEEAKAINKRRLTTLVLDLVRRYHPDAEWWCSAGADMPFLARIGNDIVALAMPLPQEAEDG